MKTRFLFSLTMVLLLVAASGCRSQGTRLTAADNGDQIEVEVGDLIVIELAGNPTTGYSWEAADLASGLVEQVGEADFSSDSPGLVGAGGSLTLTFRALQAGSGTLSLVYHRPWEADVEPIETFSVGVIIR
jgi:inhibitor of cysteine peptidase